MFFIWIETKCTKLHLAEKQQQKIVKYVAKAQWKKKKRIKNKKKKLKKKNLIQDTMSDSFLRWGRELFLFLFFSILKSHTEKSKM